HYRQVIEDVFLLFIHSSNSISNDDRQLKGERRVIRFQIRHRVRQQMTMSVLMLQPLTGESCTTGRTAEQETLRSRISSRPDEIADSLKAEHRIKDEERNRVDPVRRVCRTNQDE